MARNVRYSIRLSPADGARLLAQLEAQRPTVAAALTLNEREAFTMSATVSGMVSFDLDFLKRITGHRLDTVSDLMRLIRRMRAGGYPSIVAWMNGLDGRSIIDEAVAA